MTASRHERGADILTSEGDLHVALGVRLRERPGMRWILEIHPKTRARFDLDAFERRFGPQSVWICERGDVAPGEYHLSQRGFDTEENEIRSSGDCR